jgi:hypothetical protein
MAAHPATAVVTALVLLLCATAATGTTCTAGRVSLSTLATTPYSMSPWVYTFGFCNVVQPTATNLNACSSSGYLLVHNTTDGACNRSYTGVHTALTALGNNTGVYSIVSTAAGELANITVLCDTTGSVATASLLSVVEDNATLTTATLSSYAGCALNSYFCSDTVSCTDASKTCVSNVCFDTSCAQVTAIDSAAYATSAFHGEFSVADCHGTQLANLTNSSFSLLLNGVDTTSAVFGAEVLSAIDAAPQAAPSVTTLLLDQSDSVTKNYLTVLKAAATAFVTKVQASNANHYVALIAFDGAATPVTVLDHTNDHAAVLAAIAALPSAKMTDPYSTNLYGAVFDGVRASQQMRYSFGAANASVVSTMVVFTDGFDTAQRMPQSSAVNEALRFASTVRIISIGVADTSDTVFLTAIATSGLYSFPSTSSLVSSFEDIAQKVSNSANSYYSLAMCVPLRTSTVALTVKLNTSQFTTTTAASFSMNASAFAGGCTEALLGQLNGGSTGAVTTAPVDTLVNGQAITTTLAAAGAFYFDFAFTVATVVTVAPAHVVLYLTSSRCRLSPYCYDSSFNGTFTAAAGTTYHAMVTTDASVAASITVMASAATAAPPTLPPVPTTPDGKTIPPTPVPVPAVPADQAALIPFDYNISSVPIRDVDDEATIIFFVFGLVVVVAALGAFVIKWVMSSSAETIGGADAPPSIVGAGSYNVVRPQYTGASTHSRTPSFNPTHSRTPSFNPQGQHSRTPSYTPHGHANRSGADWQQQQQEAQTTVLSSNQWASELQPYRAGARVPGAGSPASPGRGHSRTQSHSHMPLDSRYSMHL